MSGGISSMKTSITQDMLYKQSVIKYAWRHGVTKAAIKHRESRQNIYRWMAKYDGTPKSLANKSRKPKSHPNQHTIEEIKLIKDMKAKNKETGLVVFWVKLRQRGYTRSVESLYRVMVKYGIYERTTKKSKAYVPKPYEQMTYPGERVQVDVKVVPKECICKEAQEKGEKYYQYTAIDEYTRYRQIWYYKEQTTYSSKEFLEYIVNKFPFKIECIQTDNGFEFTNRLGTDKHQTIFEAKLIEFEIEYRNIKPYTPRHNGKVERSHRKDQESFYNKRKFYSIEDLQKQGKYYLKQYNNFPMKPLKWKTPKEMLTSFELEKSA